MKKLLLVRHGKAADHSDDGDFGRPLKKSGIHHVEELAAMLKHKNIIPQIIITSTALRAKTTAEIIAKHLDVKGMIDTSDIYEAGDRILLRIINSISNDHKFVMLAGHNPGFSSIATYLTGNYVNLGTADAVLIEFDNEDWKELSANSGDILWQSDAAN